MEFSSIVKKLGKRHSGQPYGLHGPPPEGDHT